MLDVDSRRLCTLFYVVLLAMVAAFLALRLYMVLGRKTGHEQEVLPRAAEDRVPLPTPRAVEPVIEARDAPVMAGAGVGGLAALRSADPSFDAVEFVEGAKTAYRMILEAFWKGDRETIGWLSEPEVAAEFNAAIDTREAAGPTLDNRLVAIERAAITAVSVEKGVARVGVRFDSDIASVTRDRDGNVVSGSLSDAEEEHEVWTFVRTLADRDPNWKLADTADA